MCVCVCVCACACACVCVCVCVSVCLSVIICLVGVVFVFQLDYLDTYCLSVLNAFVLCFCIFASSAQLSMFHMERRSRNTLIIVIIIIHDCVSVPPVADWDDIGYSFVVGEDGNAYEARGWMAVGAHTYRYNRVGVGEYVEVAVGAVLDLDQYVANCPFAGVGATEGGCAVCRHYYLLAFARADLKVSADF